MGPMSLPSSVIVREVELDDWEELKALHARLRTDKARNYISSTLAELEAFVVNSKTFPQITLLVVEWSTEEFTKIVGLAAMMLIQAPQLGQMGVYTKPMTHCFIHAAYIPSYVYHGGIRYRVPQAHGLDKDAHSQDAGALLWNAMVSWAQAHDAKFMYGNVRLDGNFRAFEKKYGLTKRHIVIGKEI